MQEEINDTADAVGKFNSWEMKGGRASLLSEALRPSKDHLRFRDKDRRSKNEPQKVTQKVIDKLERGR